MTVKEEMNSVAERVPSKWKRSTVADGDWLQKYTLGPLSARDDFLADKIQSGDAGLSAEITARIAGDDYLSATIISFSSTTVNNINYLSAISDSMSSTIDNKIILINQNITDESEAREAEDNRLQEQIDTIEAASDVVDVVSSHAALEAYTAKLTKDDIIKVLVDETKEDTQFYWRVSGTKPNPPYSWIAVGSASPYYTKAEINAFSGDLSATISSTYFSANDVGYGLTTGYDGNIRKIGMIQDHCERNGFSYALGSYSEATSGINNVPSFAFGNVCVASGGGLFAVGNCATASNTFSISMGNGTSAGGAYNYILGYNVTSTNDSAALIGFNLINNNKPSRIIVGQYNDDSVGPYILVVGNGTNNNNRSNALIVDSNGNVSANNFSSNITDLNKVAQYKISANSNTAFYVSSFNLSAGSNIGFSSNSTTLAITGKDWNNTITAASSNAVSYITGTWATAAGSTFSGTAKYAGTANSAATALHSQDQIKTTGTGTTGTFNVSSLKLNAGTGVKFGSASNQINILLDIDGSSNKISSIGGSSLSAQVLSGGKCISIDSNNKINLSSNITANNITANNSISSKLYTGSATHASIDIIDFYTEWDNNSTGKVGINGCVISANGDYDTGSTAIHSTDPSWSTWKDVIKAGNGTWVSSDGVITAISAASNIGTQTGVLYFV